MREDERTALAARTLDIAGGAGCEVTVASSATGLTRFTQNAIHQNVASADVSVRVRIVSDGRTGVATTNDLEDGSLRALVARATEIAQLAPSDPEAAPLARAAQVAAPAGAFVAATADASPERRAAMAADIIAAAERSSLWAAGYVTTSHDGITIFNSAGTRASFDGTSCGLNVKANGADASGFAEQYGSDVASLDGAAAGERAAAKARAGASPVAVDPGAWTVILEPAALGELLSYLADHFSAQSFDEGSSFFSDALGAAFAGTNVTLVDDHADARHAGMPFDYEGYPKARVPLLEGGIARNVVTDARYAARLGRPNTGHGLPAPSGAGPEPLHIVVAGGDKSLERLIAETERGLLISRFWYIRPVDARKTIVTGMTRDGTFLVRNGRVERGVHNMRFNQSILGALSACEFAAPAVRTGGYSYSMVVPAAKIEGFRFTSTTAF
ncbi:MAG: TldD/PmbA family protein [Vulcanimicrobiaceae bacterium]